MLTEEGTPYVAWEDHVPVIGGDFKLHEELGLPDDVQVAMESNGIIHRMFNPFPYHSAPTEGITHD